uniref:condensation domain-containing protein n=1 Tax=Orrella sp. TaxID=1921583 RepID=UPI004048C0AF
MQLVSKVRTQTGVDLPLRALFENQTVESLANTIGTNTRQQLPLIEQGEGSWNEFRVLSYGQVRLWTIDRIEAGAIGYNMPLAVRLLGALDQTALENAVVDIVSRHEALRTVIIDQDGDPVGIALNDLGSGPLIEVKDLTEISVTEQSAQITFEIETASNSPFDLAHAPLIRSRLLKISAQEHVFIVVMHHIASDATSISIIAKELEASYRARLSGIAADLKTVSLTYADYASWQRGLLEGTDELDRQLSYWRKQLTDAPELLTLPTDFVRYSDRARLAGFTEINLERTTVDGLERFAKQFSTTPFAILMSCYALLLGRLSRQKDVVIGFPLEGRSQSGLDSVVGFFVNTIALRVKFHGEACVEELIASVKSSLVDALMHQDVPFERLVDDLAIPRSLLHTPLFQAWFNWQLQDTAYFGLEGLQVEHLEPATPRVRFDVLLNLSPKPDGSIAGHLEYDRSLFKASTVQSWARQFERLVTAAVRDAQAPLWSVSLLGAQERHEVLTVFNETSVPL